MPRKPVMAANAARMRARRERAADKAATERMASDKSSADGASFAVPSGGKKRYVVRGARLCCDCGSHFQRFNLPEGARPLVNGEPMMCETDNVRNENFFPFGVCRSASNRSEGVVEYPAQSGAGTVRGKPCEPIILSPWLNAAPKVFLAGKKALRTDSYLVCAQGGFIRFLDDGQPERNMREPDPEDVVAIQTRLVALGFLKPRDVKWGKFDRKTEEAVIEFQKGFLPKSKATGDIDDETWEKLGLKDTPVTISPPGYESPESKAGRNLAKFLLNPVIENERPYSIILQRKYRYWEFTYLRTYFQKVEYAKGNKDLTTIIARVNDIFLATTEHYKEISGSTSNSYLELGGAFAISVFEEIAGIESFVDTSSVVEDYMDAKINAAQAEFDIVNNSSLVYTIDTGYINQDTSVIKNEYLGEVAKLTNDVTSMEISAQGDLDTELVRCYAMDYLMRVMYMNTAPKEARAFLDDLLKKEAK